MRLLVPIILIIAILTLPLGIANADFIETMGSGIYHKDNPMTCIMEPAPEIQDRFYNGILTMTILTVQERSDAMDSYSQDTRFYKESGWDIPMKLVYYENHFDKNVVDFPDCNIFIEFSKENTGQHILNKKALGYTSIDFSHSNHQWAFIMVYLDSIEVGQSFTFCIGCSDEKKEEYQIDLTAKPMPTEAIQKIIRHEYAHALGIGHYVEDQEFGNDLPSLMYPIMNPFAPVIYDEIPIADREMLRQIYNTDGFGGLNGLMPNKVSIEEIKNSSVEHFMEKYYSYLE